jgi:hypothetical protein
MQSITCRHRERCMHNASPMLLLLTAHLMRQQDNLTGDVVGRDLPNGSVFLPCGAVDRLKSLKVKRFNGFSKS